MSSRSSTLTSCILPSEHVDEGGDRAAKIEQRVQLHGRLGQRNSADGNIDRHRSIVVALSAYTVSASSTPKSSPT